MIEDDGAAADRIITFLKSGRMPTVDGASIPLRAHSICVHGDSPHAITMARTVRTRLMNDGVELGSFLGDM
jgi:5-oxoprolinase (ATP-hydrolysing) subunit A